jgi:hypothetical protein
MGFRDIWTRNVGALAGLQSLPAGGGEADHIKADRGTPSGGQPRLEAFLAKK